MSSEAQQLLVYVLFTVFEIAFAVAWKKDDADSYRFHKDDPYKGQIPRIMIVWLVIWNVIFSLFTSPWMIFC